jgi:hypothetical protein
MKTADILAYRLANQRIAASQFAKPGEVISWLGAMQAQEYAMAKWAIGLRLPGSTNADVEKAFDRGEILRTHCMRPTWHFVTPSDIRWIQALTSPRVQAFSASYYRKMNLDAALFKRSHDTLGKALQGGRHLTRSALAAILKQAGIEADGLRLAYLLMCAELDGIICSGAREGKQFTYALLDERAPASKAKDPGLEELLARLTEMYFMTRGPATLQDFAWWSGLTMEQVKKGVAMLGKVIKNEVFEGRQYFFTADMQKVSEKPTLAGTRHQTTFLMPDYDEYGISYKDRTALFGEANAAGQNLRQNVAYSHTVIIDGRAGGVWQRSPASKRVEIDTQSFQTLSGRKQQSLLKAVKRYKAFFKDAADAN